MVITGIFYCLITHYSFHIPLLSASLSWLWFFAWYGYQNFSLLSHMGYWQPWLNWVFVVLCWLWQKLGVCGSLLTLTIGHGSAGEGAHDDLLNFGNIPPYPHCHLHIYLDNQDQSPDVEQPISLLASSVIGGARGQVVVSTCGQWHLLAWELSILFVFRGNLSLMIVVSV